MTAPYAPWPTSAPVTARRNRKSSCIRPTFAATPEWRAIVRELGPDFAARAGENDAADSFVYDNYRELKSRGIFSAGVPLGLGGGGASYSELCAVVRELARSCG